MADDLTIKKLGEAANEDSTVLVAVWSDGSMTECQRKPGVHEFECEVEETNSPAITFFERLGQLERLKMQVRILYDSESVTTVSEMGPLGSLLQGKL